MSSRSEPFAPCATPEELGKARRRAVRLLLIAVAALVLAVVAERAVGDVRLERTYLLAGALYLLAAVGPLVRISRTGAFESVD